MVVGDGASNIPAGWYPDPADAARLRRWDGARWTQDVVMARQHAVPDVPVPQPAPEQPVQQVPQIVPEPVVSPPQPEPARAAAHAAPSFDAPQAPGARVPTHAGPSPIASPPPVAPQPQSAPQPPTSAAPVYATPPAPPAPSAPPLQPAPAAQPAPVGIQAAEPPSAPADAPDWAHLPGLTLPPDLSAIPGMVDDAVLPMPRFAEPVRELTPPESVPGHYSPPPQPAGQYAPPPSGFHYDVPPPPGATYVPNEEPALPPSALPPRFSLPPVSTQLPDEGRMASSRFEAPLVGVRGVVASPVTQNAYVPMERSPEASLGMTVASGTSTVGVWLIGLLPLIQFAIVYLVFGLLAEQVVPGIQWAVILAPAILSLIFASADRRALVNKGHADLPSNVFAFIPPLYLLVRCFRIGMGSLIPLIAWVVLQAAAAVGVVILLPTVLNAVITSF